MIFSRSAEYAIRAMATLATRPLGEPMLVKQVAAEAAIPEHFLAKLLQDLARHGLLKSNKGPGGGFRLVVAPALVPLLRVVEAVDGPDRYHRCIEGHAECNDRTACALHDAWMPLKSHIVECLEGTTIADLAKSLSDKRRPLARSRRGGSRR
jgi:Rrf2 family protein